MEYPPDFTYPDEKALTARMAAQCVRGLVRARRGIVQAGGCIGLWPLAFARDFERVWTFEPAPMNWPYLSANLAGVLNATLLPMAVGDTVATVGLTRPKPQAGLWQVDGDGAIPMTTIDTVVGDAPVDAIVLDVEGHEAPALRGAAGVIARHRPVLWFEFLQHTDAITQVIAEYGYTPPRPALGGDYYSEPDAR